MVRVNTPTHPPPPTFEKAFDASGVGTGGIKTDCKLVVFNVSMHWLLYQNILIMIVRWKHQETIVEGIFQAVVFRGKWPCHLFLFFGSTYKAWIVWRMLRNGAFVNYFDMLLSGLQKLEANFSYGGNILRETRDQWIS